MPAVGGEGYEYSLSDLRTKIRAYLLQTTASDSNWADATLNQYISDTLNELKMRGVEQLGYNYFSTTAGEQTWTRDATVWKVISVVYDDEHLTQITQADMDRMTGGDWDANSGDPAYWFDDGSYIWFDKTFSATGDVVKYWYWKRPADITGDSDYCGYDKVYGPLIVQGVLKRCHQAAGNVTEYQIAKAEFEGMLPDAIWSAQVQHLSDPARVYDNTGFSDMN
jgi:hypothetical protein